MNKFLLIAATAIMAGQVAMAQDVPMLRIVESPRDTVTRATAEIVGATEPGTAVTVNGLAVKVYKTGTFATTVDLASGANDIRVDAVASNGATVTRTLQCFRADRHLAVPLTTEEESPVMMYASPRQVVTIEGAYLQYGNGDDRLGGSKMGFIDPEIVLEAIGAKGSLYCGRLASDRIAYIPKRLTRPADMATPTGVVNTESWSIVNTGRTDDVTIGLPRRLAYRYSTESSPSAIVVDIFGATDNSNWITQRTLDLGIIDHTDFRQVGEDTYRVYIYLKTSHVWGYTVGYDGIGSTLRISVRHRPELTLKGMTIGLDAGHGGENPGAISPSGLLEKDVNLDIVMRVRDLLHKRGASTVLTRYEDDGPSMSRRKEIWREGNIDLAVSVHNNAAGSYKVSGTAVLYKHAFNRDLAMCVARRLVQTGLDLFGVVGNFNFSLNGPTFCPNVLVEGMFMSSPEDEQRLADPSFRQQVAEKIVQGLEDYLRQCK